MPISPARTAAFDILLRVEREAAYATDLLHSLQYQTLSAADHRLATELVMGVLRWQSSLDDAVAELSSQKLKTLDAEVLIALRLGAYQIRSLRIPQRAAVHESVELVKRARKRSAAPFVNAILRKVKRTEEKSVFPEDTAQIAKMLAHPDWLVSRWAREHGIETARRICEFDQQVPPTAFRLFDTTAETELQKSEISTEPGRLLSTAKRLVSGDLEKPGLLRDGRIAIQDEASQLVALLVGGGSRMLDCCAAPGGKTRILAAQNPHATVVSVELHSHRARLLRKLVQQPNVQIIAADVTQLPFSTSFDKILVDVPCSGTGTLARNPEIKWRLTENDLVDLRSWQLAILRSAMHQLAIRGRLIYSTCSLEKEENEQVIEEAMSGNSGFQIIACETELRRLSESGELIWPEPKSLCRGPYLRTIPGIHPCDGFFAAILERRSN